MPILCPSMSNLFDIFVLQWRLDQSYRLHSHQSAADSENHCRLLHNDGRSVAVPVQVHPSQLQFPYMTISPAAAGITTGKRTARCVEWALLATLCRNPFCPALIPRHPVPCWSAPRANGWRQRLPSRSPWCVSFPHDISCICENICTHVTHSRFTCRFVSLGPPLPSRCRPPLPLLHRRPPPSLPPADYFLWTFIQPHPLPHPPPLPPQQLLPPQPPSFPSPPPPRQAPTPPPPPPPPRATVTT